MLPFKLVYHERYDLNLGEHVFPAQKYRLIRNRLKGDGVADDSDFTEPAPASDEDVLLVHDRDWVSRLRNGTLTYHDILKLEIPYSRQMVDGFWLAAGGTIAAAEFALRDGVGFNIGGGFHHAFRGHGEGFCAIHDVAIAVRSLARRGLIRKALIIDLDVHHGNGTAAIFAGDSPVMTISLHQYNNYPSEKPASTIDVHLEDGLGDAEYLGRLENTYPFAVESFRPDMVFYVAGADPYREDQLGGLALTMEGLKARDRVVFEKPKALGIPVVVTLAGGYAVRVEDTVAIHCNTVKVAAGR
ncbi:MAG: histone deacetylase [Bryobacteraceae bacterium]